MTDPRLERLRSLDAEATPGPWHVAEHGFLCEADTNGAIPFAIDDVTLIAAMRNAWPAVVALVEGVLARHKAIGNLEGGCNGCLRPYWRDCPDAQAALAVLDRLGEPT